MNPGVQSVESFIPARAFVSDITNDLTATVTFTAPHDFTPGELISFRVSKPYGMEEINNQTGKVLTIDTDSLTVDINTLGYSSFIYPVSGKNTPPQAIPAGSGIIPGVNPPTINLLDVFDCVGPI